MTDKSLLTAEQCQMTDKSLLTAEYGSIHSFAITQFPKNLQVCSQQKPSVSLAKIRKKGPRKGLQAASNLISIFLEQEFEFCSIKHYFACDYIYFQLSTMSKWPQRLVLCVALALVAILMCEKDKTGVLVSKRQSRGQQPQPPKLNYPHVGKLSELKLPQRHFQRSSPLAWLALDKKINTYYFTFYNWYFFEIEFVDLTYDSYINFKVFVDDQLHDRWTQRVGFKLQDSFYPQGGCIRTQPKHQTNCSKCQGCSKDKGLNLDITSNGFNLTTRQHTIKNSSGSTHDGYQYARFWYYTPNHALDDPANEPFKSDLTVTTFNISYKGQRKSIEANLTHVLRHNQCFSFLDEENSGAFKHNCVGGYGNGRIFLDRTIDIKQLPAYGKQVKSAYNLDNNRTRTAFLGVRSMSTLSRALGNPLPSNNWRWKGFRAFMQCFSKPEYYSKHEAIEKERYVGLHFARPFSPLPVQNFQDYLFYNGKLVAVNQLDFKLDQNYKKHKNITFRSAPSHADRLQEPAFQINFTVLSKEKHQGGNWLSKHSELRAYGFWTGWIDEGEKGEKVNFFNISGFIETTNSLY